MKLTATGRKQSEPELQNIPSGYKRKAQPIPESLQKLDYADLEYRVLKMWEKFPNLHLPHKYGEDLIERNQGMFVIPNPDDVVRWDRRRMEQYYVLLQGEDPQEFDDTGLRMRVVQAIRKRMVDSQMLQHALNGTLRLPSSKIHKPQSTRVRVTVNKKKK